MTWLAVILGVLFLLMSAVDVTPEGRSAHNAFCLSFVAAAFAAATLALYGTTPRFQVIGDGATWIGNGAEGNFPKQIFTVDCCHALGYVSKVCEYLARDAKEAIRVLQGLIAALERGMEK